MDDTTNGGNIRNHASTVIFTIAANFFKAKSKHLLAHTP